MVAHAAALLTFPFDKNKVEPGPTTAVKWTIAKKPYEIHSPTLDDINLAILVPHCLETKQKIQKAVGTPNHLAKSLFLIFPRMLGSTMAEMWEQLAKFVRQETEETFNATLKKFIACQHATPED
jgi:hypothetical protein